MNEKGEFRAVELPEESLNRIETRVEATEFEDANEYLIYVLEEILYQTERDYDFSAELIDEQQVEERLKSLGYLNE